MVKKLQAGRSKGNSSTRSDNWATPQKLFDELNAEFHFDLDACAEPHNAKCKKYVTERMDALKVDWATVAGKPNPVVFMNPPYRRVVLSQFLARALDQAAKGATVVCLIPAATDTEWWHEFAPRGEVRLLKGRVKFVPPPGYTGQSNAPNFGQALLIFRPGGAATVEKTAGPGGGADYRILIAQKSQLVQALMFYADKNNYRAQRPGHQAKHGNWVSDSGRIAREILGVKKCMT